MGCQFLSPGEIPDPGIQPRSSTLQADSLPSEPPGKLNTGKGSNQNKKTMMDLFCFYCFLEDCCFLPAFKENSRTGHGTTDWFQIGKGVRQGCILSPCLFNFYSEYIMRNTGLEEAQAGIKVAGRNINNLICR